MRYIPQWNPSLSVGNHQLDEQHKKLLKICGKALKHHGDSRCDSSDFHEWLNDLIEWMHHNFPLEEEVLQRNACPNFVAHKAEHDTYYRAVLELASESFSNAIIGYQDSYVEFLVNFINHHMLKSDMRDAAYLVSTFGRDRPAQIQAASPS